MKKPSSYKWPVLVLALFMFTTFAPSSYAYVDSLGRVWPGPKPSTRHKIVKTNKKLVRKKLPAKKSVKAKKTK